MSHFFTADIGGTKLATALFNEAGILVSSRETPSENENGERLFRSLIKSFETICTDEKISFKEISGVAIGIPGIVDVNAGIAIYQNNLPWRNFPLKERLQELFPETSITIDNDVYMAAWGEYAARGSKDGTFVYLTLSTGISCCTISEGQFLRGSGMAGEVGFALTDLGNRTLENTVSGVNLEHKGRIAFENPGLTLKEMMGFYYDGEERAVSIVNEAVAGLAKEVYHILLFADPNCIVLGGGIFNNHPKLVEAVRQELRNHLTHHLFKGKEQRIEKSIHKGEAGLFGALDRSIQYERKA